MQNEHTSKQFDAELEAARTRVLQMGGMVEEQIAQAVEALVSGNIKLADQVIDYDHRVNAMEVGIDEVCSQIIARRQPAAGDLRLLVMVIKTITDLERIGDEAKKIARMTKLLYEVPRLEVPRFLEIKHMSSLVRSMLRQSLDSFARLDATSITQVLRQDIQVDDEFRSSLRQLVTYMMEDPRKISTAIEILFAVKALERIGDHAKNIAEYVVYMVKGKDIRYVSTEEVEQVLQ
jgi:phosphate transport system protein